jgi:hypothetical protein
MSNKIKELVMAHFNLVEATEQSFAEIKTADGELTLTYEGEELGEGLAVFVVTEDGNIAAPDGEHALEGGITIITKDGKIESIMETPAEEVEASEEEEVLEEEEKLEEEDEKMEEEEESMMEDDKEVAAEHDDEEDMEEHEEEEGAIDEAVIVAVAEAVKEVVEEMTKDMEERMKELEDKYSTFSSAPASEKTIAKSFSKKSKSENYRNASAIEAMIARKTKK